MFTAAEKVMQITGKTSGASDKPQKIDLGYTPRSYFMPFHRRSQRFSCVVAHRRAGKTVGALMDTIDKALRNRRGDGRYAFCGPTYSQIKDVVWLYLKQYTLPLPNTKINEQELSVRLFNGNMIRLYSLDSTAYDRMRGIYLDGCTIDEYSDCDPRAIPEVIRPALADRQGWLSIIGTSKGRDAFYGVYREALKNPHLWYNLRLKASETRILPAEELEQMQEMMGPHEYARELECSFDVEGYDQLIPGYVVEAARERQSYRDPEAPTVFGLDVARFGDDRTVLSVREGNRLVDGWAWRGKDLMETANLVAAKADIFQPRMIFIDSTNLGAGVVDRLVHMGFTNIEGVDFSRPARETNNFMNLRAECYARLKEWLDKYGAIHDNYTLAEQFEDDVTALTYKFDLKNRLQISSKEDLKKAGLSSPDVGDSVALTFAELFPTYDVARLLGRNTSANRRNQGYAAPMSDPLEL
jgi:hypothetical protein